MNIFIRCNYCIVFSQKVDVCPLKQMKKMVMDATLGYSKSQLNHWEQKNYAHANVEGVIKGELMSCKEQCLQKDINGVTITITKGVLVRQVISLDVE
jgi:hypothetical protein